MISLKVKGNDFIEGKMTLPIIHALKTCDNEDRKYILNLLNSTPDIRQVNINAVDLTT